MIDAKCTPSMRTEEHRDTREQLNLQTVCQNCVTYPLKPWGNAVIYGETLKQIVVAGSRSSEVRWWDLVCVSTREGNQFPSVLLQPLRHLSVFRINNYERSDFRLSHVGCKFLVFRDGIWIQRFTAAASKIGRGSCVRPANLLRSLTAIVVGAPRGRTSRPLLDAGRPEYRVCGPIAPLQGVRVFALTWSRNRVRHAWAAPRSSPYSALLRIAANMGSISIADTAQ